ncbi:MAG: hypothetical protein J0L78_01415 [Planctomycetes bacterium]|nr:hypothetical protein [Planctomycetota bacterium]
MQTVISRRFSFLGSSAALKVAAGLVSITLVAGSVGCSSSPVARSGAIPAGSLAARDAHVDMGVNSPANPGIMSMAAGDRLGMAVYARNIELATANTKAERTRLASRPSPARPVIASADE